MALEEYREAIDLDPEYPDAHVNLGITAAELGHVKEAEMAFERAIELDPEDPLPRQELAILLMDEGKVRQAVTHLREVTKLDPENFDAFLDLGICYTQLGFYEEAEKAFARCTELEPEDPSLAYHHAALHALRGEEDEALALLRTALSKEPDRVRAWLRSDRMFDSLRSREAFRALLNG